MSKIYRIIVHIEVAAPTLKSAYKKLEALQKKKNKFKVIKMDYDGAEKR